MVRLVPLLALSLTGCAATVSCPGGDEASTPVYLLDHGRHSSLVLPAPEGHLVRYSYGDKRWYADMDTGFGQGAAALFRRTPAVLGRRELHAGPDAGQIVAALRVAVDRAFTLHAAPDDVEALRQELDLLYHSGIDAMRYNPAYDLEFVPHPRDYSGWYNSNHMVADWLRGIGCTVGRPNFLSNWRVYDRPAAGRPST